jgi:MFS family permease
MLKSAGLSNTLAGIIAASNLAGYLAGALCASTAIFRMRRLPPVWCAISLVIVTTALMAMNSEAVWLVARFITGVASGFAFVLASSIILDRAAREGRPDWVALFYSGVGTGIILTAVAVPPLDSIGGWRAGWLGLAAISAALSIATLPWFADHGQVEATYQEGSEAAGDQRLFLCVFAANGATGLAYIIPATFMVAMIAATPALARFAGASWVVVGLFAIPSTFIWSRLGIALGRERALVLALLVLGLGAIAPILVPNAVGVVLAAATLGGTFMGITTLVNALGRELYPHGSHVAIGRLTVAFGIGQIFGPIAAGYLTAQAGNYTPALMLAAGVACTGAAVMFVGSIQSPQRLETDPSDDSH